LLVSLVISTIVDALGGRLQAYFPEVAVIVFYIINMLLALVITTVLFAVIFRVLPDTETPWRDVWGGAVATAILFMFGKWLISLYISGSNLGEKYGAAGALVILLVWVYYSAMILYLGAAITKEWAIRFGAGIRPDRDAATTRVVEIETGRDYKRNKS
jgi:membrane protein